MATMTDVARPAARKAARTPLWLHALNWLADRDAMHRAAHDLRNMPDEQLKDMGITREEADTNFYRQGSRRIDQVPTAFRVF